MRRLQTNFSLGSILTSAVSQSGGWTIEAVADASRGGTNTLQATYSGSGNGLCYWEYTQAAGYAWRNVFGDSTQNGRNWLDGPNGLRTCDVRYEFKWTSPNSANVHQIVSVLDADATLLSLTATRSGSTGNYTLLISGSSNSATTPAIAGGNWYRHELHLEVDGRGYGEATLIVYTISTNTEVVRLSIVFNPGIASFTALRLGKINSGNFINNNGAQTLYFANLAINDSQVAAGTGGGSGIHTGPCGAGKAGGLVYPTSDVSVTWATTGGDNFGELDDASDATYVNSITGATLYTDRYGLAVYPGANIPRSIVVYVRHKEHTAGGTADVFHDAGLYNGTNRSAYDLAGVGNVWTWQANIIDEIYGGGALTVAEYDLFEFIIRKYQNNSNLNDKEIALLALEVEDSEGVALTTVGAKDRRRGHVY